MPLGVSVTLVVLVLFGVSVPLGVLVLLFHRPRHLPSEVLAQVLGRHGKAWRPDCGNSVLNPSCLYWTRFALVISDLLDVSDLSGALETLGVSARRRRVLRSPHRPSEVLALIRRRGKVCRSPISCPTCFDCGNSVLNPKNSSCRT